MKRWIIPIFIILIIVISILGVQAKPDILSPMNSVIEWRNKGDNFYAIQMYDKSLNEYDKALELVRNSDLQFSDVFLSQIWNSKGNAFTKLGRYYEALNAYDKAIELYPSSVEYQNNKNRLFESFPELINKTPAGDDTKSDYYSSRLEKCKEMVRKYYDTHLFQLDNYDCDDMTLDLTNQLKKEYINSKIGIGDIDKDIEYPWESTHAWVIAEYEPDSWIALEGTGGYVVSKKDNPRYFKGWFFDEPLEFKKYRELKSQLDDELEYVDQLKQEFNASLMNTKERISKEVIIKDHEKKYQDLEIKIVALSQGVHVEDLDLFNLI